MLHSGSARQTDGQLSSALSISSTYGVYNLGPKYNGSIPIIIKVPQFHNPVPTISTKTT
jgi:hypothetical protein